ncbi:pheromone-regulated protein [Martiniozyma asiatica (nom. inval.)]|nr:pheromone-regulated protein [Martiniozyma asiatica]
MYNKKKSANKHSRSRSGLSLHSLPTHGHSNSFNSLTSANSLQQESPTLSAFPSNENLKTRPSWDRSRSSESIGSKSFTGLSTLSKPGFHKRPRKIPNLKSAVTKAKGNKFYNLHGASQSMDAVPIMEDDEDETVLNVPMLPSFQGEHPRVSKRTVTPRQAKFFQNDSEEAFNEGVVPIHDNVYNTGDYNDKNNSNDSNVEISNDSDNSDIELKHAIDEDFEANCVKSDWELGLKRKKDKLDKKRVLIEQYSSDDDVETENEFENNTDTHNIRNYDGNLQESKSTKRKPSHSKLQSAEVTRSNSLSSASSEKSQKTVKTVLSNLLRTRSKSIPSRKSIDLEKGFGTHLHHNKTNDDMNADDDDYTDDDDDDDENLDLDLEKIQSTASSAKSKTLLNKIFNLEGFLNGGGLTPASNLNIPLEDEKENEMDVTEKEKLHADYIVQQALRGLNPDRQRPSEATFQLGGQNEYIETGNTTGMAQANEDGHSTLVNRSTQNDGSVYVQPSLQEAEFDDLQNFDDYSIDVPNSLNKYNRKRAGIGSLLFKLNNTITSTTTSFSGPTSSLTADTEFMHSDKDLESFLGPGELEEKLRKMKYETEIDDLPGVEPMVNAFENKRTTFIKKVPKPASIKKMLTSEGKEKGASKIARHTRNSSFLPDFDFKDNHEKVYEKKKKKMFKRKKETAARITVHIADLLARQRFILLLCKAFMMYGAPTHRLEEYMAMTAKVLEVDGSFIYFPGCMLCSFGDITMRTSEMRLVRCNQGLDLSKLDKVHDVYKSVVHDRLGVDDGCKQLNDVLNGKVKFNKWLCVLLYAICSVVVAPWGYGGSWIDLPICFGIGGIIGFLQFVISPINTLYSSVFEVTSSIVASFLARAIGSINNGETFCYAAIVQSALALILPGYIILCGSLELQSRNLVAGSVRMFYAFIYSLMLSFGMTLGAALYGWIDSNATSSTQCTSNISPWYRFLFVPLFTIGIALCNQASWKQLPMMCVISGAGYVVTYFASLHFTGITELNATLGCFIIGLVANLYSRLHKNLKFFAKYGFGTSMTVSLMLPAIFVQVPSGIASQGSVLSGINTANSIVNSTKSSTYTANNSSLTFGMTMIQVALGISVGLYLSTIVVYPFGKKNTGLFTL